MILLGASISQAYAGPSAAFVGNWDTWTSIQLTHFRLTLTAIDDDHVSGDYQPQSPGPPGHLEGSVVGDTLSYNWSVGTVSGTGTFVVAGDTLNGQWQTSGPSPFPGTWNGTRIPSGGGGFSVSAGGVTISLDKGGVSITSSSSAGSGGGSASSGGGPIPSGLPQAKIKTGATAHAGPSKSSPAVEALAAGLVVGYEQGCPNSYCHVYWNGGNGYVWKQLLDFGAGAGGSGSSGSAGGMGGGGKPPDTAVDFSGNWDLSLTPTGGSPVAYVMQIGQTGTQATATIYSSPQVVMACGKSGSLVLTCSWSDASGTTFTGTFSWSANTLSGNWQSADLASTGSWTASPQ